jgi:hypothetical protein
MTNNKQQTAVEWLLNQLKLRPSDWIDILPIYEQAKEMEKVQIKDAYNDGHTDGVNQKPGLTSGTIYYNEIYGGNK